jgi:hypothetical protein
VGSRDDTERVLGTVWIPKEGKLSYKIKSGDVTTNKIPVVPSKLTKRKILSKLAAIFDPIGVAAAIVIKSKIALCKNCGNSV